MAEGQTATLLIRRGGRKGRRFTLKGEPFKIGQDAGCDLVLKDEFVSPIHTIVELRGEQWVATNRGVNGTLVNAVAVQGSRALASGDIVQVGGETLLQFDLKQAAAPKKKAKEKDPNAGPTPWWARPIVVGGLGAYMLAMVGAFVFLSGISLGGNETLTAEGRHELLDRTRAFVMEDPSLATSAASLLPTDPDADPAAAWYAALQARAGGDPAEIERRVEVLMKRVDGAMVQAWLHEQQDKLELAKGQYERITRMVPSLRAPVTVHAVAKIAALESRIESVWR